MAEMQEFSDADIILARNSREALNLSLLKHRADAKGDKSRRWSEPHCCQCRRSQSELSQQHQSLTQCSRCKVTRYCSRACQKKHYKFHKGGCLLLSEMEPSQHLLRAHTIFQIAYRSSDTLERFAYLYEPAIEQYYKHCLTLLEAIIEISLQDSGSRPEEEIIFRRKPQWEALGSELERLALLLALLGYFEESLFLLTWLRCKTDSFEPGQRPISLLDDLMLFPRPRWDSQGPATNPSATFRLTAGYLKLHMITVLDHIIEYKEQAEPKEQDKKSTLSKNYSNSIVDEAMSLEHPKVTREEQKKHWESLLLELDVNEALDYNHEEQMQVDPLSLRHISFWRILLSRNIHLNSKIFPDLIPSTTEEPVPPEFFLLIQDSFFLDPMLQPVLSKLIPWYE